MPKPRIALLVATPLRDLAGLVLVARALCQRGADVRLVPQVGGFAEIWAMAPDFVLVPAFRPYYAPRIRKYIEVGIQFGLLDTEQSVYRSPQEYEATMWGDRELFRAARCACMWGPAIANHVIERGIFTPDQVVVTGCPRFDYYCAPLDRVYAEMIGPSLPGAPRSILVNTNFTIGNYSDNSLDALVENFCSNYGTPRNVVEEWIRTQKAAIVSMVDLARRLAGDFPDLAVVVRPHPQEKEDPYREGARGLTNLHVVKEGPVAPWILRSLAVVQRSCSTAIEAVMSGIPALSPRWIEASHEYPLPEALSAPMASYEDLRDTVGAIAAGTFRPSGNTQARIEELMAEWLFRSDGRAHERVADTILESLGPIGRVDTEACRRLLYGLHTTPGWTSSGLGNRARYVLDLPTDWSFRSWEVIQDTRWDPHFNRNEVETLADAIHSVGNGFGARRVVLRDANEGGVYITPKFRGRSIVMETP